MQHIDVQIGKVSDHIYNLLTETKAKKFKAGFMKKDGSYRVGFTEEDFQALIEHFLRPRMKTFLFETKKDG